MDREVNKIGNGWIPSAERIQEMKDREILNLNWNRMSFLTKHRGRYGFQEELSMRISFQNAFSCGDKKEAIKLIRESFLTK